MRGFQIFTLVGVPVIVTPFYLLLLGYYSWSLGFGAEALIWVVCVTLCLLIHEFGHALVARHYKLAPTVLLHGFGGLCAHQRARRDLHDVFIISAGPALGILFAVIVSGAQIALTVAAPEFFRQELVRTTFFYVWWISFIWNFVNLVPLWPLDGGQLFRLGMVKWLGPARGEKVTHTLGAGLGVLAALGGLQLNSVFLALIAGFLAWENIRKLQTGESSGPVRRRNRFADELYQKAQKSMADGDWREAARLGHQIRAEGNLDDRQLDKVWELLAISTARQGDHEEALSYIQRSPRSPMIVEAHIRALASMGRAREAREVLDSAQGQKLPARTREDLEAAIDSGVKG